MSYGTVEGIRSISAFVTTSASSAAGAVANSSSIAASISSSSNLPNYPRQLLGSYRALMHLLNCKRDSPAVDAATSTVSSESVPIIIAAVAAAAASAAADATPHLHVSPKLADPVCDWTSRSIRQTNIVARIGVVLVVVVPDTSMCWS